MGVPAPLLLEQRSRSTYCTAVYGLVWLRVSHVSTNMLVSRLLLTKLNILEKAKVKILPGNYP